MQCFCVNGSSNPTIGDEVEDMLLEFHTEQHCKLLPMTIKLLVTYQRSINGTTVEGLSDQVMRLWISQFIKHHGLVLLKKSHTAQLSVHNTLIKKNLVAYIAHKANMLGVFDKQYIANVDETNMYFAPIFKQTLME